MARLWSCGFELQSATSGVEWDTTVGSPAISTTTVRSGGASLRCNPTAAAAYGQHRYRPNSAPRVFHRMYFRFDTFPSTTVAIMAFSDGTAVFPSIRYESGTNTLAVFDLNNTKVGSSSAALNLGQWYRLELEYLDGFGAGDSTSAYLDGVAFASNVQAGDMFGGDVLQFGILAAATADMYIDDIAVNDDTGTAQTGLPGSGAIVHLKPNAAGDNNGFATAVGGTAGAANNFTRVSETTPDDTTSYNNTTATGTTTIDDFNVTDSATAGIPSASAITLVQVGQRAGSSATTTASIVTRIKGQAAGTTTESASIPVNTTAFNTHATATPKTHALTAYTNPQTSTAWTTTSLDSMQIGYRGNVSQTTQRRITTLWALVEFVAAASAAAGIPTAVGAGQDAIAAVGANAGAPSALATAFDATVATSSNVSAPAELATAAASASDATIAMEAGAAAPSAAAAAQDVSVAATANAAAPASAASAQDAVDILGANGDLAAAGSFGLDPSAAIAVNADLASASAAGFDATVSTSSAVNAAAEAALTTAAAQDAAASIGANAGTAAASATALDVTAASGGNAGVAAATSTAFDASVDIQVPAGTATAAAQAFDAMVSTSAAVSAPADVSAASATALDAGTALATNAGTSAAAATAFDATVTVVPQVDAPAGNATATASASDSIVDLQTNVGTAMAAAQAFDATVTTVSSGTGLASTAAASAAAFDATIAITTQSETAAVAATTGVASVDLGALAATANAVASTYGPAFPLAVFAFAEVAEAFTAAYSPLQAHRPGLLRPGSIRSASIADTLPYPRLTASTVRGPAYTTGG